MFVVVGGYLHWGWWGNKQPTQEDQQQTFSAQRRGCLIYASRKDKTRRDIHAQRIETQRTHFNAGTPCEFRGMGRREWAISTRDRRI